MESALELFRDYGWPGVMAVMVICGSTIILMICRWMFNSKNGVANRLIDAGLELIAQLKKGNQVQSDATETMATAITDVLGQNEEIAMELRRMRRAGIMTVSQFEKYLTTHQNLPADQVALWIDPIRHELATKSPTHNGKSKDKTNGHSSS